MKEELATLMKDYDESYGTFQMGRLMVARVGGTVYGMYLQALRELSGRIEGLKSLHLEEEELLIDMTENIKKKSDTKTSIYDSERASIKVKRCLFRRDTLDKKITRALKEISRLFNIASHLKEKLGEITPERRDRLETEFRLYCIKRTAMFEMKVNKKLSYGSMEDLFSIDPISRIKIIEEIESPGAINDFLHEGCEELMVSKDLLSIDQIKGLLE